MTPTERNRLDEAASPYLRQHADNPVNWQPWDEQALTAAREHDVPIFLSVGYSACHWCHVMEEESFADESVAELLNERFVPIKVDREERPDIDRIYQTVCQQVSGRGGWPLSVWLTPDGDPFYVGTYFPRESRRGMPGFVDVLESISDSWSNDREEVLERAAQWAATARQELESTPDADRPGESATDATPDWSDPPMHGEPSHGSDGDGPLLETAATLLRAADRQHGGFGSGGPKFPQPPRIDVLLRSWDRTGRDDLESVLGTTLDAMIGGGLYDHLGGGFHRYATDREWVVPHFEKMLYDNAELPRVYTDAYRLTGEQRYRLAVEETAAFVDRELRHPEGGLFSTLNAQSPDPAEQQAVNGSPGDSDAPAEREGAFYVWTPESVREAIGDEALAELFCDRYGVTERGNFEGETVLTIDATIPELAADRGVPEEAVRDRLQDARERAFEHRAQRPHPSRDEKVIGAWNGLFIGAAGDASLAIDSIDPDLAVDALAFVRNHLWDGERLARRYRDGDVGGEGYLEDYAFLGRGAFRCYEATGDVTHLAFALAMADVIEAAFWEPEERTLFFTPSDGESLIARPQEPADQSTPSSMGVATELLLTVDSFVPHDRYGDIAAAVVDTYRGRIDSSPLQYPTLAICADRIERGDAEITVVTSDAGNHDHVAEMPPSWRSALGSSYVPNRILAPRPATPDGLEAWLDQLGLDDVPPIWKDRNAADGTGGVTVYVCRNRTCSPPLSSPSDALEWIDRLAE